MMTAYAASRTGPCHRADRPRARSTAGTATVKCRATTWAGRLRGSPASGSPGGAESSPRRPRQYRVRLRMGGDTAGVPVSFQHGRGQSVMTTTYMLETAEASIAYDVRGPLPTADGRPPLF